MICEICRGSRLIRLPVQMDVTYDSDTETLTIPKQAMGKTYPCPECSPAAPLNRVRVVDLHSSYSPDIDDPNYLTTVRRSAAARIGVMMLEKGLISFRKYPPGPDGRAVVTGTVGVIAQTEIDDIERRIEAKQIEFANAVIAEAAKAIYNWGSYYNSQMIDKDKAVTEMASALKRVSEQRKGTPL